MTFKDVNKVTDRIKSQYTHNVGIDMLNRYYTEKYSKFFEYNDIQFNKVYNNSFIMRVSYRMNGVQKFESVTHFNLDVFTIENYRNYTIKNIIDEE